MVLQADQVNLELDIDQSIFRVGFAPFTVISLPTNRSSDLAI